MRISFIAMKRSALITGTSSGIGFSVAQALLNQGYRVYGLCRRADSVFVNEENYTPLVIDLRKPFQIDSIDVDTVICNAGVGILGKLEELSPRAIEDAIMVNFTSQVLLIKKLLPDLKKKNRADILFVGSEAAFCGKRGGTIYCATKFAIRGFCQALREECGTSGVKVSMVHPSMVDTEFYNGLSIRPKEGKESSLLAEDVAKVLVQIIESDHHVIYDEVVIKPKQYVIQKNMKH